MNVMLYCHWLRVIQNLDLMKGLGEFSFSCYVKVSEVIFLCSKLAKSVLLKSNQQFLEYLLDVLM